MDDCYLLIEVSNEGEPLRTVNLNHKELESRCYDLWEKAFDNSYATFPRWFFHLKETLLASVAPMVRDTWTRISCGECNVEDCEHRKEEPEQDEGEEWIARVWKLLIDFGVDYRKRVPIIDLLKQMPRRGTEP